MTIIRRPISLHVCRAGSVSQPLRSGRACKHGSRRETEGRAPSPGAQKKSASEEEQGEEARNSARWDEDGQLKVFALSARARLSN